MFNQETPKPRDTSSKQKLAELNNQTDMLVYGSSSSGIKERDKEMDKLISNTLKTTIKGQFGNTNKPLEYFSLNMLNDLWSKTGTGKRGTKKKDFEDVLKQYVYENQTMSVTNNRIKYDNYRNIYSHIPAAHVALNIYKSSILSPESLTDEPINFMYDSSDDNIKKIMEQRVK
jgi:predicted nucleotidyltransferase